MALPSVKDTSNRLRVLAELWAPSTADKPATFQSWMLDLLDALGAERPVPPTAGSSSWSAPWTARQERSVPVAGPQGVIMPLRSSRMGSVG